MGFEVVPAIDLRAGRVVRLREGDFARETEYGTDPLAVAESFAAAGARWLHLVDLDGARGEARQTSLVNAIVRRTAGRLQCQVGGGLRDEEAVAATLAAGATRVVLGTVAIRDRHLVRRLVATHGTERIVAALDVRDGQAVGEGWRDDALELPVHEALDALAGAGIDRFIVTSIARDGGLGGPDLELLRRLVAIGRGVIFASGGIASISDLKAVRDIGCGGAIVGRAIYDGVIDLAKALAAFADR
jgi:phosphoribosylformimino-5-aminoimidazole carboxamide ribotide isomerase